MKNLSDFLSEKLSVLIKNEYDLLIKILNNLELDSQEIFNNIDKMLLIKIKDRFKQFHEYDKLSILVLGKTGVGKTTLINSILNKETNEERIGLPDEMDEDFIKKYNRELFPSLDIWDSRGIELSQKFNIEKYSEQIINFLKKGYENKEINNIKKATNFIQCIWYCITGTRIEKSELEFIKKLKTVYSSDKKLPIIFVYTQSYNKKTSETIKKTIINELKIESINYIDVVAKEITFDINEDNTIKIGKKGLKELMNESLNLAKAGFESLFFGNIFNEYKNSLNYFLSVKPLINSLEDIQKKTSSLYAEKYSYKYINENFCSLLNESLSHMYLIIKKMKSRIKNNLRNGKK